jgi:hypothetical protein
MGRGTGAERRGQRLRAVPASALWVIAALGWLPLAAQSAEAPEKPAATQKPAAAPAKPAADEALDEDLLEFLGTIDAEDEDEDWIDYLTQTDIEKVAARKRPKPAADATEVRK